MSNVNHATIIPLPQTKPEVINSLGSIAKLTGDVDTIETTKTVVVFNHMNLDSLIAAAILKRYRPDFVFRDPLAVVPKDADKYVWIGMQREPHFLQALGARKKNHVVFNRDDLEALDDAGTQSTLIMHVCAEYGIDFTKYQKLAYLVSHFYDKNAKIEDLVFVSKHLFIATDALDGGEVFSVSEANDDDKAEYLRTIKRVKSMLDNQLRLTKVQDGAHQVYVAYTNFADPHYIFAQRLLKLVHENLVNHSVGQNGNVVYTNLHKLALDKDKEQPIMMH